MGMRPKLMFAAAAFGWLALSGCDDESGATADAVVLLSDRGIVEVDAVPPDAELDGAVEPDLAVADGDVIDGGADAGMGDAAVQNEICQDPPEPPAQPRIVLSSRCREDGGPLRIRDLRDARCDDFEVLPTSQPGRQVTLDEAIVSGVYGTNFTVQDPEGGTFSGLWVYNRAELPVDMLQPGTRVRLSGQVIEFFTLTELVLGGEGDLEVLGQGQVPPSILVSDPSRVADDGDLAEALESVLLRFENNKVIDTAPDCPSEFGMFVVTGGLRVDDETPFDYQAARGDLVTRLTGVLTYSFNHQKVLPRGDVDIETVHCGGRPDKCEAAECPVTEDAEETGALVITELQTNPRGDDATREFLEIYNPGPSAMDLTNWWVQDCGGNRATLSGRLNPGDYHVIAASRDRSENGGIRADGEFEDFFLPNGNGSALLFNAQSELVDQVRYTSDAPWPLRDVGQSLELDDPSADNRSGGAWYAGEDDYGAGGFGSPGRGR